MPRARPVVDEPLARAREVTAIQRTADVAGYFGHLGRRTLLPVVIEQNAHRNGLVDGHARDTFGVMERNAQRDRSAVRVSDKMDGAADFGGQTGDTRRIGRYDIRGSTLPPRRGSMS